MSKATEKRRAEEQRADGIDTVLTYLEASDYRPAVREFLPAMPDTLLPIRAAVRRAMKPAHMTQPEPLGLVLSSGRPGAVFQVDCCWPSDRESLRRVASMVKGDVRIPADAVTARVATSHIYPDGSVRQGMPVQVFTSAAADPSEFWFPVVMPTSTRKRRVVTSSGWAEYDQSSSGYDGMVPAVSCWLRIVFQTFWSVRVAAENGLSELILPADEAGVKGFFDLRDAPVTASGRRAALRHWVRAHSRRLGTPNESGVKAHYRGVERFDWFGLKCRVVEPHTGRD